MLESARRQSDNSLPLSRQQLRESYVVCDEGGYDAEASTSFGYTVGGGSAFGEGEEGTSKGEETDVVRDEEQQKQDKGNDGKEGEERKKANTHLTFPLNSPAPRTKKVMDRKANRAMKEMDLRRDARLFHSTWSVFVIYSTREDGGMEDTHKKKNVTMNQVMR
jgi:hypothetical protein